MALTVEIVTPTSVAFRGEAVEIEAPGFDGEFGVLPGHAPFLSVMRPGLVTLTNSDGKQCWIVGRGFVEAGPDQVVILAETVEGVLDVDRAAAQALLEQAERKMIELDPNGPEFALAVRDAGLARARLSV